MYIMFVFTLYIYVVICARLTRDFGRGLNLKPIRRVFRWSIPMVIVKRRDDTSCIIYIYIVYYTVSNRKKENRNYDLRFPRVRVLYIIGPRERTGWVVKKILRPEGSYIVFCRRNTIIDYNNNIIIVETKFI